MKSVEAAREGQLPQGRVNVIGVVEDVVQGTLFHGMPATFVYFPTARATAQPVPLLARGRGGIVREMVGGALRPGMIGAAAGALLAFAGLRAASSVIELIPTFGLRSYAMAGAIVLGASAVAAWLPSRRAARMDPAAALRAE